ncbi:MAG: quinone oxidoreductase [Bauldia sp.]
MANAVRVERFGPPDAMAMRTVELAAPAAGEVLLRQTAIGVNFIDVYQRSGAYPMALPFTPGNEGTGIVEAIGPGVTSVLVGDRVAYAAPGGGAYADRRIVGANWLVRLPAAVDYRTAAAVMLKGLTAEMLLHRVFPVRAGQTVLVHAAAGAVGLLLCQWASAIGAHVIGTVGSAEKARIAAANGCSVAINYREDDFVARVKEATAGEGVDVVYDSVGKDVFPASLDCLKPFGMWVLFGQSSGAPPPLEMQLLNRKGCLFATRPTVFTYVGKRDALDTAVANVFGALAAGTIRVAINQTFPLAEAAAAHRALEARSTTGATVLLP